MTTKLRLLVNSIADIKSNWIYLFLLLDFSILYLLLATEVSSLRAQVDTAGQTPTLMLVTQTWTNFLLRVGCFLVIPFFALKVSVRALTAALIMAGLAIAAGFSGLTSQAWYFAVVALICFWVTWNSVGPQLAEDTPSRPAC